MLRKFRFSHSPPQAVALLLLVAAGACRPSGEPGPPPLRLADAAPALAAPAAGGGALPSGFLEVPFEDWRALRGTEPRRAAGRGLVLGSGSLVVRSWRPPVERRDTVESVELELTSTQPGTLRLEFLGDDAPAAGPTDDFLRSFSRGFEARLPGGDAVQQVLLQSPWSVPAQAIRSLALAAELAEGGNLEVRALRVRFQSAGLRVADSGIGLHGLHEI